MALQLEQINLSFFEELWHDFSLLIPKLLLAILILILAWIASKILGYFLRKILKLTRFERLNDQLNEIEFINSSNININLQSVIVKIAKWILIFIAVVLVSDILGLNAIANGISNFIGYLPKLFSALAIWILGILLANFIKKFIHSAFKSFNLTGSTMIGNVIFFLIVVFVTITALNQAGINTQIITNNLTLILGSFLLAFTIAFGLGSREIIQRLLLGFYSRKNLTVGQKIKIGNKIGIIESIDNINLVLRTDDGKFVYPIKKVNDKIIQIFDEKE